MQLISFLSPFCKSLIFCPHLFKRLILKRNDIIKFPGSLWHNHLLLYLCFASGQPFFSCMFFSQQIATQIAVLIAKVARLDCPRQWPELIPILLESVKGQDGLQQHRALLTFYHVTKTLASKRLAQDRRLFQDVSPRHSPFHCQCEFK